MVLLLFFNSAYRRRGSVTKYSAPREGGGKLTSCKDITNY